MLRNIRDIGEHYDVAFPLRQLAGLADGHPIYHLRLGHGPLHTVVDVMPHGGELFWLTGPKNFHL